jgi:hypothetical protein
MHRQPALAVLVCARAPRQRAQVAENNVWERVASVQSCQKNLQISTKWANEVNERGVRTPDRGDLKPKQACCCKQQIWASPADLAHPSWRSKL